MRPLSAPQLAVLDSAAFSVAYRVLIADGDGTMRDYSAQQSINWIDGVQVAVDVDQPISQATIRLRRDVINSSGNILSLAPLRTDSILNRNAALAYAPAIDTGRAVQVLIATTVYGVAPSGGDWQNLFEGSVLTHDASQPTIVLGVPDRGQALLEAQVETETTYGTATGRPLENVFQDVLDDWKPGVTLYCPVSPGFMVTPVKVPVGSVMSTLQTMADWIGWTFRYMWDSGTSTWRPTLVEPNRTKTAPDRTVSASRYFSVQKLEVDKTGVRNAIYIAYPDLASGTVITKSFTDSASIVEYGRQYLKDVEPSDSPVDTDAEVTALGNAMLSDMKDPKADQVIENHFDWSVELGDLQRYSANVRYNTAQDWAVVGYTHTLSANQHRTTIQSRGRPCGKYYGWRKRATIPATVADLPALLNFRITAEDATTVTYSWTRSDTVDSVWYATSTLAAPVPSDPWATLSAAVTPISDDSITLTKPTPGNYALLQVEPRNANLVAGDVARVMIAPGQQPINFGPIPQGTVSIDSNGWFTPSVDGTGQFKSYRWEWSTSAYPDDATTAASGDIVNGQSFSVPSAGQLDFGETAHVTVIGFSGLNATGTASQPIHIRGSYQTYSATKTVTFSAGSYKPDNNNQDYQPVDNIGTGPTSIVGASASILGFTSQLTIPDGCHISYVTHDLKFSDGSVSLPGFRFVAFTLYRISGTTRTSIASGSATPSLGWQTISSSANETVSGDSYLMTAQIASTAAITPGNEAIGPFSITYDIPDPSVGV